MENKIKTFIAILLLLSITFTVFGQTSATKGEAPNDNKATLEAQTATKKKPVDETRGYIVSVGDKAPDYEMTLDNGTVLKSSDNLGKVVMLQFTASWCGVCRKEMPLIEAEIWEQLKDNPNFVLVGVDRDEPLDKVLKFKEQTKVTYPLALDPGSAIFGLFARKKSGVTRNVIIDQNGEIVFLTRLFERGEFDEMKDVIFDLLEEKKVPASSKK